MAVNYDRRDPAEIKASSLSGDTLTPLSRTAGNVSKRGKEKDRTLPSGKKFSRRGFLVDLLVLLVLAGVIVGAWFGYGALQKLYTPVWETRQVEFCVEIGNIDYDRADQLLPTLTDRQLWSSDHVEGECLGIVSDVRAVPSVTEDNREIMTLYLTVTTQAKYRKGEGYFVGDTRLLAGETGIFRAESLSAEGMVVSVQDVTEVKE